MSVVLATDIVIAGRSTRMRPAYPGIGFSPDGGITWTLPRIVGLARARDILLQDRFLTAEDRLTFGMASSVVDDGALADEANAAADRLSQGPSGAFGRIKGLLVLQPDFVILSGGGCRERGAATA